MSIGLTVTMPLRLLLQTDRVVPGAAISALDVVREARGVHERRAPHALAQRSTQRAEAIEIARERDRARNECLVGGGDEIQEIQMKKLAQARASDAGIAGAGDD